MTVGSIQQINSPISRHQFYIETQKGQLIKPFLHIVMNFFFFISTTGVCQLNRQTENRQNFNQTTAAKPQTPAAG